jgi:hypothetical protein
MKTLEYVMGAVMLLTPKTCPPEHKDMAWAGIHECPVCHARLDEEAQIDAQKG